MNSYNKMTPTKVSAQKSDTFKAPLKQYRKHFVVNGNFSTPNDFITHAYKERMFRFLPGTTHIIFNEKQEWLPTDKDNQKLFGKQLYDSLASRNNYLTNFGVRFFVTCDHTKSDYKIEQQVINSEQKTTFNSVTTPIPNINIKVPIAPMIPRKSTSKHDFSHNSSIKTPLTKFFGKLQKSLFKEDEFPKL